MANMNQLLSVTSYSTHMKDLWEELNHSFVYQAHVLVPFCKSRTKVKVKLLPPHFALRR